MYFFPKLYFILIIGEYLKLSRVLEQISTHFCNKIFFKLVIAAVIYDIANVVHKYEKNLVRINVF